MKTEFVPKLVATVTVCCASYVVLAASDKIVTVKTLASVGYFDALVYLSSCRCLCSVLIYYHRCYRASDLADLTTFMNAAAETRFQQLR